MDKTAKEFRERVNQKVSIEIAFRQAITDDMDYWVIQEALRSLKKQLDYAEQEARTRDG